MKTILLLSFIMFNLVLNHNANCQAPNWLWANKVGGSGLETAGCIAVDGSGNTYITGTFGSSTITFGSTTLTNASIATDIFVAKYDAAGNALWAKRAGGTSGENGRGISVDGSGNCYMTGSFMSSTISFDTITITNASSGGMDFFIVKFDASGNALWVKRAGGTGADFGNSIVADASGNSYVTGGFGSSSITFGSTTLTNATSYYDIFVVKYDASGNALWAKSAGGNSDESGASIAVNSSGNSFITGAFSSTSLTFGSVTLTGTGADFFIAKFDGSGNVLWAANAPGGVGVGIAVDGSGNCYASGSFGGTSITFGSSTLTNAGNRDMFIVKYNTSGNVVWATGAGGTDYDGANSVLVDGGGNVYVNGYFQSPTITLGTTTLTNTGGSDVFIAKYSSAGNALWATGTGGTGNDLMYGLALDGSDHSYTVGIYYSPSIAFGSTTLNNSGSSDVFITKLEAGVVGMEENNSPGAAVVFPNPFSSELFISNKTNSPSEVFLYDITGRQVFSRSFSHSTEINTGHLDVGIYFYRVKSGNEIINSGKVIKQ